MLVWLEFFSIKESSLLKWNIHESDKMKS